MEQPLHLHGSHKRDGAAGEGAVIGMREFLRKDLVTTVDKSTFVLQVIVCVGVGGWVGVCGLRMCVVAV